MNLKARCMSCGWEGTYEEGQEHDSDAHLVAYKVEEPQPKPCGCMEANTSPFS